MFSPSIDNILDLLQRDGDRAVLAAAELDEFRVVEVVRRDHKLDARVRLELVALHLLEDRLLVHLHRLGEAGFLDRLLIVRLHGRIALEYLTSCLEGVHRILFGKFVRDEGLDGRRCLHGIAAVGFCNLLRRVARLFERLARRRRLAALQDELGQDEDRIAVDRVAPGAHMDGERRKIDEGELVHRRRSARQERSLRIELRRQSARRIDDGKKPA